MQGVPVDAEPGRSSAPSLCCLACHGVTVDCAVPGACLLLPSGPAAAVGDAAAA